VIAVDGTAASGKSTLARRLAERLGYLCFDTGVLYRAVTWAACARSVPIDDQPAVERLAEGLQIEVLPPDADPDCADGRPATVRVDGQDITWEIRTPEIDRYVSQVSSYPGVRRALLDEQRAIGRRGRVVMVGRDVGTVVMPEAELKLFVDAAVEERARRRHAESVEHGLDVSYDTILEEMRARDRSDREKPISPMIPASDAVIIDSSGMSVDELVERVVQLASAEQSAEQSTGPAGAPG
jgi:cytidylate kinase